MNQILLEVTYVCLKQIMYELYCERKFFIFR